MKPVTFDGWIYVIIAMCGAMEASFTSDEAAHYINPVLLFILKSSIAWVGAGSLALKMYRSTAFADYKTAKNGSYQQVPKPISTGNTEILTKTTNINEEKH